MDKREAMMRELNLYPFWVLREPVANIAPVARATAPDPVAATGEVIAAAVAKFETPVAVAATLDAVIAPAAQIEVALPSDAASAGEIPPAALDLFCAPQPPDVDGDSLRDFQLKNAGGALGQLNWNELKHKVRDCELCGLRADCSQTVFGTGDEQADYMFIGEAPGAREDELGEPFTGPAGHLLDNMFKAIALKRDDAYLANVIKCRPVDDRHPHVGEIASCLPYLQRQISLIKPRIIVALGKTAASALLDTDATISSLRGRVHDYRGIPLIVTFHPAYLLRSPMEKAKSWQDLCLAVDTMQERKV